MGLPDVPRPPREPHMMHREEEVKKSIQAAMEAMTSAATGEGQGPNEDASNNPNAATAEAGAKKDASTAESKRNPASDNKEPEPSGEDDDNDDDEQDDEEEDDDEKEDV